MDSIAWGLPLALIVLACPLMMVGMMAFGWLFMRGSASHSGHGMMMCHSGHGGSGHERHEKAEPAESTDLVADLKAQRERLDQLITRVEEKAAD
jgi:hypothetical protein